MIVVVKLIEKFQHFSQSKWCSAEELKLISKAGYLLSSATFTRNNEIDVFRRDCFPAHFTASAFIVDFQKNTTLLTHHKKLKIWIQLGGHADGDSDLLQGALREAYEESGLTKIEAVTSEIFDFDIHLIPENKKNHEPAHYHYDVRFLFHCADRPQFQISEESLDLSWVAIEKLETFNNNLTVQRMGKKFLQDRNFLSQQALQFSPTC